MGLRMPVMDGIEATSLITAQVPGAKVLVLTSYNVDDLVAVAATGFADSGDVARLALPLLVVALVVAEVSNMLLVATSRLPTKLVLSPGLSRPGAWKSPGQINGKAVVELTASRDPVGRLVLATWWSNSGLPIIARPGRSSPHPACGPPFRHARRPSSPAGVRGGQGAATG